MPDDMPIQAEHSHQGDRGRPAPGRGHALRRPQERARIRRRHEHAARGHLRRAQRHPRRQGPRRAHARRSSTTRSRAWWTELPRSRRSSDEWDVEGRRPAGSPSMTGRDEFDARRGGRPRRRSLPCSPTTLEAYLRGRLRREGQGARRAGDDRRSSARSCCASSTRAGWPTSQEMDYLKTGIGLRAFGQRDPLVEYKNEAYARLPEPDVVDVRGLPAHDPAPADRREEGAPRFPSSAIRSPAR